MLSSMLAMLALLGTPSAEPERPSYLFQMDVGPNRQIRLQGERYNPQPGDLVLFDGHCNWTTKLYRYCGTNAPLHAGVVFAHPDGSFAILEAGADAVWKVFVFDLQKRLHTFDGTILIRSPRAPLNPAQSQRLTEFSLAQEGKPYALGRLMLQGTPFRPQGTVRTHFFGRTKLDRERWICSELVVAAVAAAGVFDPRAFPANAMYPRDLCYDERYDLSPYYHAAALWYPRADLEHVGKGVRIRAPREQ